MKSLAPPPLSTLRTCSNGTSASAAGVPSGPSRMTHRGPAMPLPDEEEEEEAPGAAGAVDSHRERGPANAAVEFCTAAAAEAAPACHF